MAQVASSNAGDAARASASGRPPILRPGEIFDPVARALEVIGDRWTLVLVRQLIRLGKYVQRWVRWVKAGLVGASPIPAWVL